MKQKTDFLLEAETARQGGYYNRAVVALATAFHHDHNCVGPQEFFSAAELAAITEMYVEMNETAETLFSAGMHFDDYAYYYALTHIVDWYLLNEYYSFHRMDTKYYISTIDLQDMIRTSVKDKKNHKTALPQAANVIKDNKQRLDSSSLKTIFNGLGINI